jgi:preprotein translocase subunit SecB
MTQVQPEPSPEEVGRLSARIGGSARLSTIGLRELHWKAHDLAVSEPMIDTDANFNIVHVGQDRLVRYRVTLKLKAIAEGQILFELEAAYDAIFELGGDDVYSEEEYQAFGSVSVFFMLYPYLRSVVHRVTVEGGFPPLILAPIQFPFGVLASSPVDA